MSFRVPHSGKLYTSLKQSGELLSDATVNQKQFLSNNASNNNTFSSINNIIKNNKVIIDSVNASVSEIKDTIKINQDNLGISLNNLEQTATKASDLSLSSSRLLFNKTNVLFEEAYTSVNTNIKNTTSSVLFVKHLVSNQEDFNRTTNRYIDYSPIRQTLDAKNATLTDVEPVNVSIWSTDFVANDDTNTIYNFTFNNLMYSKYEQSDYNDLDNHFISDFISRNNYINIKNLSFSFSKILNEYLIGNPISTNFFHVLTIDTISQSPYPVVIYAYFKKYDNDEKNMWSIVFASSSLSYKSIATDKTKYKIFTDSIVSELNTWSDDSSIYDDNGYPISKDISTAIEYGSPLTFTSLRCVSSPIVGWSGKLVSELIMHNSDIDVSQEYNDTITKLWNYFPELSEEDIVIITGTLGNYFYCNIIKIVSIEGKMCFIQKQININSYFPGIEFNNDLVINGSLDIKTMSGENVLKTDNVRNIMTIGQKVGINQDVYQVKGLLDIDNIANKTVDIILNNFTKPLLDSYELTERLKQYLVLDTTNGNYILDSSNSLVQELLTEYKCATFSCPIVLSINESDISFDHTESNVSNPDIMFSNQTFNLDSFGKIKTIVSHLYTMLRMDGLTPDTSNILSFCELLGDRYNMALCSLRSIIKPNNVGDGYILYSFVTYSNINKYYYDNSYKKNIEALCDGFSRINQFLNYANFLVEDITIKANLLQGNTNDIEGETFTGHINNSSFFRSRFGDSKLYIGIFNYPGNQSLYLLHEAYRWFENKPGIANFIPNTDVQIDTVLDIIHNSHTSRFGEYKMNYIFPVQYDFNTGPKMSFVKVIEIQGTKYVMFCEMNITDYIDLSIVSKGDNKITGNLSVVDEGTNNNIFNVDIVNKLCSSMYNTGIGTNTPQTKLDIIDCGVVDVIEIINKMAERMNEMNNILVKLKTYMVTNGDQNLASFFNSQSQLVQDPSHYYSVNQLVFDNFNNVILTDIIITYHKLYPTWNNKAVKDILATEVQNKSSINFLYKAIQNASINNMYFHDSLRLVSYDWINGVKLSLAITFKVNNNFYLVLTGIDLQTSVTINTNTNIQALTNIQAVCANILQDMVTKPNFKNIPDSEILNKDISQTSRLMNINKSINNIRMFKYDIDTVTSENTKVTLLDNQTYAAISSEQSFGSITDFQLKNKITFINLALKEYYDMALLPGQYGTLHCEDDYLDYLIFFWVKSNTNGILTIYSQEITIKDILVQSLQLRGDAIIKGDLYMYDTVKNENFLLIDSDNRFLGLNTTQMYGNYSNSYLTTSNNDLAKHNLYVKTNGFPNTVLERRSENPTASFAPSWQPNSSYYYFQPFSTLSSRRQSEYFTFRQMYENSQFYSSTNAAGVANAFGINKLNPPGFGTVVAFEIKDKTGVIKEMGGMGVVMESLDNNKDNSNGLYYDDIRGAFEVNVIDRVQGTSNVNLRTIMYCSNDSNLYVNKVSTNDITFNNNKNKSSDAIDQAIGKLWVDPDTGDLMFQSKNGPKKVKLEDP